MSKQVREQVEKNLLGILVSFCGQSLEESRERCRDWVLQRGMSPMEFKYNELVSLKRNAYKGNMAKFTFMSETYLKSPNDFPIGKASSISSTTSRGVICVL